MSACGQHEAFAPVTENSGDCLDLFLGSVLVVLSLYDEYRPSFDVPVFYTPNGVNTEFYHPALAKEPPSRLRVGWAGSLTNREPGYRCYHELIAPAVQAVRGAELIAAAKANHLDFVIMTEHPQAEFDTSAMTLNGTHAGVLFINGNEVASANGDRLLLIPGTSNAAPMNTQSTLQIIEQQKLNGGRVVVELSPIPSPILVVFWTDRPVPLSTTMTIRLPDSIVLRIEITPIRWIPCKPCTIAFSTSGCRRNVGTRAGSLSTAISNSTVRRSAKRTFSTAT